MVRSATARRLRVAASGVLMLVVLGVGAQAVRVHHHDGQWALVASVAPERITVAGRDYRRAGRVARVEGTVSARGTTSGGGAIYTPSDPGAPTVIWVQKDGTVWEYLLLGGP